MSIDPLPLLTILLIAVNSPFQGASESQWVCDQHSHGGTDVHLHGGSASFAGARSCRDCHVRACVRAFRGNAMLLLASDSHRQARASLPDSRR